MITQLGYNPLTMTGCVDIVEAVNSTVSMVSYIGFDVSNTFAPRKE